MVRPRRRLILRAMDMNRSTTDLASLMAHLGLHRFHLLGYSMGGRMALALTLAQPQRLRALVLESASPGIADAGERAARRLQDESLARHIELEGVRNFVAYWEQLPMFASQRQLPAEIRRMVREQRLKNSARGLAGSPARGRNGRPGQLLVTVATT